MLRAAALALSLLSSPFLTSAHASITYTATSLHPVSAAGSTAYAIDGMTQGGTAIGITPNDKPHAHIWSSTAASSVDIHPTGFLSSSISAVSGSYQVGFASNDPAGNIGHAIVWNGTAQSAIDLLLPGTRQLRRKAWPATRKLDGASVLEFPRLSRSCGMGAPQAL